MSTRMGLLSLFTILVPCGQLFAADLPVTAPIKAVTVFPDRAEVTREVEVSLPAGATTLVIDNLPASLFPESVRVSGEGAKDVVIGSVETKPFYADAAVSEQERLLQAAIVELQDRRRAAEDRIASLQVQLDFIATIGRDMPATANEEIQRGSMDPAKWQAAWTAMSSGAAEARAGMRAAEIEMRDIDAKTAKLQQELAQIQTGQTATVVARINLEAGTAAEGATLRLSYQLPGATWQPLYDARLDSEAGKMSLAQLGQVQQRTGEDWTGVALTLSTAQPSVGAVLPELDSWFVQVAPAELVGELRRDDAVRAGAPATTEPQNMADMNKSKDEENDRIAKLNAQLVASEFSAEYRIPGTANVPSDAAPHKFGIATHDLAAQLAVRTVPKQGAVAHLYATVTYDGSSRCCPARSRCSATAPSSAPRPWTCCGRRRRSSSASASTTRCASSTGWRTASSRPPACSPTTSTSRSATASRSPTTTASPWRSPCSTPCRCRRTSASRSSSSATPRAPPRPTGKPTRACWPGPTS